MSIDRLAATPAADARRIWVVDDDRSVRFVLATALRDAGYAVDGFDSAAAALSALGARGAPDLLFTDVRMPGDDGLVLLDKLKATHPQLPVIVMSAYTDVASTAGAFRGGAHEFLSKPFDLDDAVALAARTLPDAEETADAAQDSDAAPTPQLIGDTPAMRALFRAIGRLAQAPLSVLITGETGTGKELVAHALHHESPRSRKPFVALNTAAIPSELLESELFGHEAGAFTGAQKRHTGRFEQADGGTLFLDEIGDMPLPLQVKLLRVLQDQAVRPVGATRAEPVDVRVLSATHRDLEAAMAEGLFREDLYYRLDVVTLTLPRLEERREDIPLLANHFMQQLVKKYDKGITGIAADALEALSTAAWPGNVRQLYNVVEQCCALATTALISLPLIQRALRIPSMEALTYAEAKQRFERNYLIGLLKLTEGNVADAARIADRNRTEFYRLLQKYELTPSLFRGNGEADDDAGGQGGSPA